MSSADQGGEPERQATYFRPSHKALKAGPDSEFRLVVLCDDDPRRLRLLAAVPRTLAVNPMESWRLLDAFGNSYPASMYSEGSLILPCRSSPPPGHRIDLGALWDAALRSNVNESGKPARKSYRELTGEADKL